ncbi:hypothetical protein [Streptomyces sp. VRA16 Mangrove soil]|uniref:hypothetical protein n=1 Tax=Streptomyces sp. VRA16 Mangrove soil TaxID=2817434 RepID=UPI001A9F9029|nr:hypothetical protein [Streptomyces sp. VRA16 Mangrove soil]MBO1330857.1 hypothetical protein [Streptomyces sp. VRA16 Mangrove soil]
MSEPLSEEQLDAYIRARLSLAGFDLSKLPEQPDPATGVPTRTQALASLRSFVASTPAALSSWSPPAKSPEYAQQESAPLIYPSIAEAWGGEDR